MTWTLNDSDRDSAEGGALEGTWRSQLGSTLLLFEDADGSLRGTYRSAVGLTVERRPLVGASLRRPDGSAVMAFVVRWPVTDSLASWTGRYDPRDDEIVATWLLEAGCPSATAWRATHLGQDRFRRAGGPRQ